MSTLNVTDYNTVDWDSVTIEEWVVLSFGIVCCICQLVGVVLIIIKRDYPPIRAKQVPLAVITGISGMINFIGNSVSTRVFPQQGPFLWYCSLWMFFFTYALGLFLFVDVFLFRLLRLYVIFNLRKEINFVTNILLFFTLWLYPLIFAIVGSALNLDGPVMQDGIKTCLLSVPMLIVNYICIGIYLALFIFLAISLRNCPKKVFDEYSLNRNLIVIFILIYIINAVIIFLNDQRNPWGRAVIVVLMITIMMLGFFGTIGVPLYHSIIDPEDYERKFWDSIQKDVPYQMKSGSSIRSDLQPQHKETLDEDQFKRGEESSKEELA